MKAKFSLRFAQFAVLLAVLVTPLSTVSADENAQKMVDLPDFSAMVEQVKNSVVNVTTTQMIKNNPYDIFREFFGFPGMPDERRMQPRQAQALGSGFIVESDEHGCYIVTNNHVVEDAKDITVTFQDATKLKAKVVGRDEKTDLALLKVDTKRKCHAIKWGDSENLKVGHWVLALGYPFRLGLTVTKGIVSALGRNVTGSPFEDFIQTDAAINVGNSGGPLVNTKGEVVGVNAAILSPSGANAGVGFAIPSSTARSIIAKLRRDGKIHRGWIGVQIDKLRPEVIKSLGLKFDSGAVVVNVGDDTPAKESGLRPGDIIQTFNGQTIKDDLGVVRIVADTPIGKSVEMKVWRPGEKLGEGETVTLKITVGDRDKAETSGQLGGEGPVKEDQKDSKSEIEELGILLAPLTPDVRAKFGISKKLSGIVVVRVDPMGPARGRLQPGDVITKFGQKPIKTVQEFANALKQAKQENRGAIILWTNRAGSENFITLPLPEDALGDGEKAFE